MALERQHGAGLRPLLFYGRVGRGIPHENYGDALSLAQGKNWEFWPECVQGGKPMFLPVKVLLWDMRKEFP